MSENFDAILVGGGIMSATLGTLIHELEPSWKILVVEKRAGIGEESSNAWNNAGTGHSALCELNYTPQLPDGKVIACACGRPNRPSKAIKMVRFITKVSEFKNRCNILINI